MVVFFGFAEETDQKLKNIAYELEQLKNVDSMIIDDLRYTQKKVGIVYEDKSCRVCGCTDYDACVGGCHWVEENLCSECQGKEEKQDEESKKN